MALSGRKIKDSSIRQYGVQSAPDKLTGTAAENKKVFDQFITAVLQGLLNGLIDDLGSTTAGASGASQIGIESIAGVNGGNVLAVLTSLKTQLDAKVGTTAMAAELELKAEKSVVAGHIKSVEFDAETGVFTFVKENGSEISVDTALEKVVANLDYDADKQALVMVTEGGTRREIPLSAFITEQEFLDSDQIAFSVSGHKVKATLKTGSITETMLSSALVNQLKGYTISAGDSATAAADSAAQAKLSATAAEESATRAASAGIEGARAAIGEMDFTAETVAYEERASVEKSIVDGVPQIRLKVPQGFSPKISVRETTLVSQYAAARKVYEITIETADRKEVMTLQDGEQGAPGTAGVASTFTRCERIGGSGKPGSTDIYAIYYRTGAAPERNFTFSVHNGADGAPFTYEMFTEEQLKALQGKSGVYVGSEEPADESVNVWIDTSAGATELLNAEGVSF